MNNLNMPAMPVYDRGGALSHSEVSKNANAGFTKREEIASRNFATLLASVGDVRVLSQEWLESTLDASVEFADMLLKKLEETE